MFLLGSIRFYYLLLPSIVSIRFYYLYWFLLPLLGCIISIGSITSITMAVSRMISLRTKVAIEFDKLLSYRDVVDQTEEVLDDEEVIACSSMLKVMKSFAQDDGKTIFTKCDLDFDEWENSLAHLKPDLKNQLKDMWEDFLENLAGYNPHIHSADSFFTDFVRDFLGNWEKKFNDFAAENPVAEYIDPILSVFLYLEKSCSFQNHCMRERKLQIKICYDKKFCEDIEAAVKYLEQLQKEYSSYRFPDSIETVFKQRNRLPLDPLIDFYSGFLLELNLKIMEELKTQFEDRFVDDDAPALHPAKRSGYTKTILKADPDFEDEAEEEEEVQEEGSKTSPIVIEDDDE